MFYRFLRALYNPTKIWIAIGFKVRTSGLYLKALNLYRAVYVLPRVSHKRKINVIFLAMTRDMWKYDGVYRLMRQMELFHPIIVTAMRVNAIRAVQISDQHEMMKWFCSQGYEVVPGLNEESGAWLELKTLEPDIIFYTQPYDGAIHQVFRYQRFWNSLICYAPYSFQLSRVAWNWNNPLQNACWRHYLVSPYHCAICREYSDIKARNAVAVGYFFYEAYTGALNNCNSVNARWRNDTRKRVIWAPHHSIYEGDEFRVSSFLEIADIMVRMREKYRRRIVFAFKPHPVLISKLSKVWGDEKANAYYDGWRHSENSFLDSGPYVELFAGSDAMIHCSGSFIVEYLYANKPVQYVYARRRNPPDLGPLGDSALQAHYCAHYESDIEQFLERVVLEGRDTLEKKRTRVIHDYLRTANGLHFSENVVTDIISGLQNG